MRRILWNQWKVKNRNLASQLIYLYKTVINNGVDSDLAQALEFSITAYESDMQFPTPDMLQDQNFQFIKEDFENNSDLEKYVTEKTVEFRTKYRDKILLELQSEKKMSHKDRMDRYDKLVRLEMELQIEKDTYTKSEELKMEDIINDYEKYGPGIKTNIPDLDEITGGISNGKIMVIFAPPGSGKSAELVNMVATNVMEGDNTLVLSLEIPKKELKSKVTVRFAFEKGNEIQVKKVIKGIMTDEEKQLLIQTQQEFDGKRKGKFLIMDTDDIHADTILAFQTQLTDIIKKFDIKTIYLDFIQQIMDLPFRGFKDKRDLGNALIGMFRYVSVTMDVRFILLSQVNREGMKNLEEKDGQASMSNLLELNKLEQYAYYILALYCNDDLKMSGFIKWSLLKHRDGETQTEFKQTPYRPSAFAIGNLDYGVQDLMSTTVHNSSSGFSYVSLFDEVKKDEQPKDSKAEGNEEAGQTAKPEETQAQ